MKKQKNIFLTPETIEQVSALAGKDEHSVKFFMERQITAMGSRGISYLELWDRGQTTAQKLKELSSPMKGGNSKN